MAFFPKGNSYRFVRANPTNLFKNAQNKWTTTNDVGSRKEGGWLGGRMGFNWFDCTIIKWTWKRHKRQLKRRDAINSFGKSCCCRHLKFSRLFRSEIYEFNVRGTTDCVCINFRAFRLLFGTATAYNAIIWWFSGEMRGGMEQRVEKSLGRLSGETFCSNLLRRIEWNIHGIVNKTLTKVWSISDELRCVGTFVKQLGSIVKKVRSLSSISLSVLPSTITAQASHRAADIPNWQPLRVIQSYAKYAIKFFAFYRLFKLHQMRSHSETFAFT